MNRNDHRRYVVQDETIPILTSLMLFLLCGISVTNALTPEEIAKKALDATVLLVMVDANGEVSGGSGFFVQPNLIATNFHVIDGAEDGRAKPVGQETVYAIERVCGVDEDKDLAILQVSAPGIEPLPLGHSDSVSGWSEGFCHRQSAR